MGSSVTKESKEYKFSFFIKTESLSTVDYYLEYLMKQAQINLPLNFKAQTHRSVWL